MTLGRACCHRRSDRMVAVGMLVLMLLTPGRAEADQWLKEKVWSDPYLGIAFREPTAQQAISYTSDDDLALFTGAGFKLRVRTSTSRQPMTIEQVKKQAIQQFSIAAPSSAILADDRPIQPISERPTTRLYFVISDGRTTPWVRGQVLVLLDTTTLLIFELDCDQKQIDRYRDMLEQVAGSLKVVDRKALALQRDAHFQTGAQVVSQLTFKAMAGMVKPQQWMRIVDGRRDVGYLRIKQGRDTQLKQAGMATSINSRIFVGPTMFDTSRDYFLADDMKTEIWSIRTTQRNQGPSNARPQPGRPGQPGEPTKRTWAETGVQSAGRISVTRERSTHVGVDEDSWQVPPSVYLSQVQAQFIHHVLPTDREQTVAVYAYDSNAKTLGLRLYIIKPMDGGVVRITLYPAPMRPPQIWTMTTDGKLLKRRMGDGREMIPAEPMEIARQWKIPLHRLR